MARITIAIDGPSGAGKSSVARRVAAELGYTYIDTGAMYRAVAWAGLARGVAEDDTEGMERAAADAEIRFELCDDGTQKVLVGTTDVTAAIRTPRITRVSSPVSAIPGVRTVLVARQQAMGAGGGVVMEGRDIGTVVFPHAELKVFLTASEEERADRRWKELTAKGQIVAREQIQAQQRERDARDSSRDHSPLRPAEDSVLLESDGFTLEQVVQRVLDLAKERGAKPIRRRKPTK